MASGGVSVSDATLTAAIQLEHIFCRFRYQEVLRDLNITIRRAESLAIIGESGCGKSVTMKIMMQLLHPTAGGVSWFGRDATQLSKRDWQATRLKFGYLFQGAALFDSLNIFENVAFGLQESGSFTDEQIHQIVMQRLDDVGLSSDVAGKHPSELSGGMQKRVGLARALALDPEVMFYDEPTTGLDPITSRRIDDLIDSVKHQHNVSSIVVTHDMRTVERVADRVVMLAPCHQLGPEDPQIIFEGSVDDLFNTTDPQISEFVNGGVLKSLGEAHTTQNHSAA